MNALYDSVHSMRQTFTNIKDKAEAAHPLEENRGIVAKTIETGLDFLFWKLAGEAPVNRELPDQYTGDDGV